MLWKDNRNKWAPFGPLISPVRNGELLRLQSPMNYKITSRRQVADNVQQYVRNNEKRHFKINVPDNYLVQIILCICRKKPTVLGKFWSKTQYTHLLLILSCSQLSKQVLEAIKNIDFLMSSKLKTKLYL